MQRILWGALWVSSVVLYGASRVVFAGAADRAEPPSPVFGPIIFAAAVACGGFGIVFPWTTLAATLKRRPPSPAIVMAPAIIGLAMSEALATCALAITAVHAPAGYATALFGLSWLLFSLRFPTARRPLGLLGPVIDLSGPP